jgi:hypothetical protein
MVSTTKNDRTEKLGITLPKSLLRTIDGKQVDVPRSTYIRRACILIDMVMYKQNGK